MSYRWYRTFYRPLMRLAHRFGWHYAPINPVLTNDHGWHLCRCAWCGLSGFVMPLYGDKTHIASASDELSTVENRTGTR